MSRAIDLIVIHCSASPNGRWTTVEDIDAWHAERGFHRRPEAMTFNPRLSAIGYHWVIYTNGARVTGRALDEVGAHAAGWNTHSIGICLVGTDQFTPAQWATLADQVRYLAGRFRVPLKVPDFAAPPAIGARGVCGHRELPAVAKSCPGFDAAAWLAGGLAPLPGHVLEHAK